MSILEAKHWFELDER